MVSVTTVDAKGDNFDCIENLFDYCWCCSYNHPIKWSLNMVTVVFVDGVVLMCDMFQPFRNYFLFQRDVLCCFKLVPS